jgi:hypothetical protein
MKGTVKLALAVAMLQIAATSHATLIFFRSVPDKGAWVELRIDPGVAAGKDEKPSYVRLTAGEVTDRQGKRHQRVDLSGSWAGQPLKAQYQVDLAALKERGGPAGCVRLQAAWVADGEGWRPLTSDEPLWNFYSGILIGARSATVSDEDATLDDPPALKGLKLRLLTVPVHGVDIGVGGNVKRRFRAWISDQVPFGVAKWEDRMEMPDDEKTVITTVATLAAMGSGEEGPPKSTPGSKPGDGTE